MKKLIVLLLLCSAGVCHAEYFGRVWVRPLPNYAACCEAERTRIAEQRLLRIRLAGEAKREIERQKRLYQMELYQWRAIMAQMQKDRQ